MRTTLDIDDDVLAAAKELARLQGQSAGRIVSGLLRQALAKPPFTPADGTRPTAGVGGFRPFASRDAPVTNAAIDALLDVEGA